MHKFRDLFYSGRSSAQLYLARDACFLYFCTRDSVNLSQAQDVSLGTMKRRITFIYDPDSPFDPKQLEIEKKRLKLSSLKAAREEQWTTNIYDLPQEV